LPGGIDESSATRLCQSEDFIRANPFGELHGIHDQSSTSGHKNKQQSRITYEESNVA
jgi:hypothetical protein